MPPLSGSAAFSPPEFIDQAVHWVVLLGELLGVAVIAGSVLLAVGLFIVHLVKCGTHRAYHELRVNLGRGIVIGLEFLVAADIIRTVAVEMTWQNVGTLAVIVLIRTFLSISLEVEIDGHWPWKKRKLEQREGRRGDEEETDRI